MNENKKTHNENVLLNKHQKNRNRNFGDKKFSYVPEELLKFENK